MVSVLKPSVNTEFKYRLARTVGGPNEHQNDNTDCCHRCNDGYQEADEDVLPWVIAVTAQMISVFV